MNTRERFKKVLHWEKPDRVPDMEFGYWDETIQLWHSQGLPDEVNTNEEVERYLGLEGSETIPCLPVINGLHPFFPYQELEDLGDHKIIQDPEGNICKTSKQGGSIPQYIKYGIETYEDWERYQKERLDYTRSDRIGDIQKAVEEAHVIGMPVRFNAGSLYGVLRNWMGVERFSIALLTEKKWVIEMMDHLTEMTLFLIEKSLPGIQVDVAWWWEDMCYNQGPLLSPQLFEELLVPRYRLITDCLKKYKVDVNILDCDGKIYQLVPGWLKGGINCMFPIEAAHTSPLELRKKYENQVLLFGGVNKVELAKGKNTIDQEMNRLCPLVKAGGYIPCVDHRVPPDISFENYLYYLEKKREIL